MLTQDLTDTYSIERTCEYRNEIYQVRDNGAILRLPKKGKRNRPKDCQWTFGLLNRQKGYLHFTNEAVHRIVATAFHGSQPSDKHIVDHIDTNKQNNRPENLRWVTRLENILLNPISLSRVIYKYGSIDNFLANPSKPTVGSLEQDFSWMRTVTKEESENTKNNLLNWAKEGKTPKGGALGEWVFSKLGVKPVEKVERDPITPSLTQNALQMNWKTPTEFPKCPSIISEDALKLYSESLKEGTVFCKNGFGEGITVSSDFKDGVDELFVISQNTEAVKPFALAKVFIQDNHFIHESLGTFFELNGVNKASHEARGLTWEGGDSIDNYC